MRAITVAVALMFAVSSQSQQRPQPSRQAAQPAAVGAPAPLVEKIDVEIVNVDVNVTDRKGRAVRGLTREDFEIREDGQPQRVTNFSIVEDAAPLPSTQPDYVAPESDRFRCKVLVLVDGLNTSAHTRIRAMERLEQFLENHFTDGRYDWSLAMVDRRVHLLLPMTANKTALHEKLSEISHGVSHPELKAPLERELTPTNRFDPRTEIGEAVFRRTASFVEENKNFDDQQYLNEETMAAQASVAGIVDAARSFATTEGRKIILLVTGNLPLASVPATDLVNGPGGSNHLVEASRNNSALATMRDILVREANASNTSFYIVSSEGQEMQEVTPIRSSTFFKPGPGSLTVDTSAMYWLASQTGGAFLPGSHLDQSFADFDRRSANYYALGYPTQHGSDNRYHHISVTIPSHPEYRLQHRDGYSGASTDVQLNRALRTALGVSMQTTTLPMTLSTDPPQYRGLIGVVPITAAMKLESLQFITDTRGSHTRLHVYVSVFDAENRNITLAKALADIVIKPDESPTGPMTVTIPPVALSKGTYRIVVAVRDELTDHVGMAAVKIDI